MKIVTRYLAREVYTSMLAAIIVLLFIFLSNQFVRYMHSAASGVLSGKAVKILLLLQLPILSSVLLPASLFLGILLAYGRLYADSEMTIFSACGVNPQYLLVTTLKFSAVVMLLVATLSLWLNPKIYKYSDHLTSGVTSNNLEMIKPNSFNLIANGQWVFYVEKIAADKKHFYDVFAAQQPSAKDDGAGSSLCVVVAKSAHKKIDPDTGDLYMVLVDGYRYLGTPGEKDYEVIKYNEYGFQLKQAGAWRGDASSQSTVKLWRERHNVLAAAELQWRISLPLSALILALLATPLSRVKPKRGRYAKLAPAILLYVIYANFLFLAKAWIKRGVLVPTLGMWWVHGLMVLFAIFLIGKQIGWWRILSLKK